MTDCESGYVDEECGIDIAELERSLKEMQSRKAQPVDTAPSTVSSSGASIEQEFPDIEQQINPALVPNPLFTNQADLASPSSDIENGKGKDSLRPAVSILIGAASSSSCGTKSQNEETNGRERRSLDTDDELEDTKKQLIPTDIKANYFTGGQKF
jgi:hypothetical protein